MDSVLGRHHKLMGLASIKSQTQLFNISTASLVGVRVSKWPSMVGSQVVCDDTRTSRQDETEQPTPRWTAGGGREIGQSLVVGVLLLYHTARQAGCGPG